MKKIYLTFFTAFSFIAAIAQVPFTAGNLVVLKIGNGNTLSNASTPVSIVEYTTTGTLVQSFFLDSSSNGLTIGGSASSEGFMSLAYDKSSLVVPGYGVAPGTATPSGQTAATINRVVAVINKSAVVDYSTRLTDAYNGSNIRSAYTTDGVDIWTGGNGGSGQGATAGIRFTRKGFTTSTRIDTNLSNVRVVSIYNGQLYETSGSGTSFGVSSVGTGVPYTPGQRATLLPGFPSSTASPYAFSMSPAGDVLYVADDRANASGGGVQKWVLTAGVWTLAYTLNDGLVSGSAVTAAGARGVTVDWSTPATPKIYATTSGTSQNTLESVVDAGDSTAAFSVLATAAGGFGFRGVAFAPTTLSTAPVKLSSFTTQKNSSSVSLNWVTEQEFNTKSFIVQRSNNGANWSDISTTSAAGNSNIIKTYSINDNSPLSGFNYYRLKQVNEDGSVSYSFTRKVLFSTSYKVLVTPNPAKDFINVYVSKNNNSNTLVKVIDLNGQVVRSESTSLSTISISTNGIAKGVYFVKVIDANNVTTKKISVQ